MHLFKKPNIDFLSQKYICFAISATIIIWGAIDFMHKKDTAFGIDFAGGQIQEFKFSQPITADAIRGLLKEGKVESAVIQTFPNAPENVIIRTQQDSNAKVVAIFKSKLPDNTFQVLRIEKVGPVVGQALRIKAIYAIVLAMLGMLIYIGIRFKHFSFGAATVVAIFHDVLITLSLASYFWTPDRSFGGHGHIDDHRLFDQ